MTKPIEITVTNVVAVMDLKYSTAPIAEKQRIYNDNHGDLVMRAVSENPPGNLVPLEDIAKRANEIRQEYIAEIRAYLSDKSKIRQEFTAESKPRDNHENT